MRLAQLARKLALRPSEIVDFLAMHKIQIEDGSNTRLEDDYVTLIMSHYAPAMVKEVEAEMAVDHESESIIQSAMVVNDMPQNDTAVEILADEVIVVEDNEIDEVITIKNTETAEATGTSILSDQSLEGLPEVIRAPKVELPGLKVIGKIEIPEPKKKEVLVKEETPIEDTPTSEEFAKPPVDHKRLPQKRKERDERTRRNPIAIQRDREAFEAEQKRREDAKREKEKRTRNYLKKVKTAQPVKAVRLVDEQVVEMSTELNDVPKTWWGRFKKWLTS